MTYSARFREAQASREACKVDRSPGGASSRELARAILTERLGEGRASDLDKLIDHNRAERLQRLATGSPLPGERNTLGSGLPVRKPGSPLPGESTPRGVDSQHHNRVRSAGDIPSPPTNSPRLRAVDTITVLPGENFRQALTRSLVESSQKADEREAGSVARTMARKLPLRERDTEQVSHEDETVPHWRRPRARRKVRRLPPA